MNAVPRPSGATRPRSASLAATLAFALIATLLPATTATADDTVTIPDANLRTCISAALAKESLPADFTATNLATLTGLPCSTTVANLTGMESLTGLTHLSLKTTTEDLSPLTSLAGLQYLAIVDSNLTDASPIATLPNIAVLLVKAPLVTSYSFALGHANLVRGIFEVPLADDLAELAKLPALTDLQLINPSGSARAAAGALVGVTQLSITTNTSDGLTGLAVPSRVTSLTVSGANLTDLVGLESSLAHTNLTVSTPKLTSLNGIDKLPHLTGLKALGQTSLHDISALDDHPDLTTLDLTRTAVADLSALSGATALTSLTVNSTPVTDLGPIRGHLALRSLDIVSTSVSDLGPLAGIPLTSLNAAYLGLSDVTVLADLGPHAKVRLEGNHIKDFSPLPDDAEVSIGVQSLPDYPTATVGTPFDFQLRSASGEPLCPKLPAAVHCANGAATYPVSGTYRTEGGDFSFTQYAGPNRRFTHPAPTLQGGALIGHDISINVGEWNPTPAVRTIRWYRDGVNVTPPGGPSYYSISAADVGHRIKACDTASLDGYDTATVCTAPTAIIKPGKFDSVPFTRLAGTKRVGHTLTAVATAPWDEGAVRHYQWYRDGKRLRGETSASYRLRKADRRHLIKVRITATKPGYTSAVRYTASYRIR